MLIYDSNTKLAKVLAQAQAWGGPDPSGGLSMHLKD